MKRTSTRRLAINRETLRRLGAGELAHVAGGRLTGCTYKLSGCQGVPQTNQCAPPGNGDWSKDCEDGC